MLSLHSRWLFNSSTACGILCAPPRTERKLITVIYSVFLRCSSAVFDTVSRHDDPRLCRRQSRKDGAAHAVLYTSIYYYIGVHDAAVRYDYKVVCSVVVQLRRDCGATAGNYELRTIIV